MLAPLLCVLLAGYANPLANDSAVELRYTGTLTPAGKDADDQPVKRFSLYAFATPPTNGTRELIYFVEERGSGTFAWPERFGKLSLAPTDAAVSGPRILQEHNGIPHAIKVSRPIFEHADKLAAGATWKSENLTFQVRQSAKVQDRDCWQVEVSTNFGRKRTVYVAKDAPIVMDVEERIFMGQGDEFSLRMKLEGLETLPAEASAKVQAAADLLLQLQADLGRSAEEIKPELTSAQLDKVGEALAKIEQAAEGTPFSRLASTISRDVKSQKQRTDEVAQLSKKFLGQTAPKFTLYGLDGKPIPAAERADKITVLHFWDYQGEPLIEPYGQVGYIDFLHSRRRKLGVQIYGVAVDERFADKPQVPTAQRSVTKLKNFMNLSYTLTADDGELIKQFGDPRRLGAKLPLWVVIDPSGKVVHYHVGFYQINPDEGLRQLDEVLVKLIQEQHQNK